MKGACFLLHKFSTSRGGFAHCWHNYTTAIRLFWPIVITDKVWQPNVFKSGCPGFRDQVTALSGLCCIREGGLSVSCLFKKPVNSEFRCAACGEMLKNRDELLVGMRLVCAVCGNSQFILSLSPPELTGDYQDLYESPGITVCGRRFYRDLF